MSLSLILLIVIKHIEDNKGALKFITKEKNALRHSRFDDKEYPCDYEWVDAGLYFNGEHWIIQDAWSNQELNLSNYGDTWHLYGDDIRWDD